MKLVALATFALTATAAAQPAPAAPQTDDWAAVSHVNGQLVKVGERTEYLRAYRRAHLASNPIGWILGFYGLSGAIAVNEHVALRGDANLLRVPDGLSGYQVGASAQVFFKRVWTGPYLEGGVLVRRVREQVLRDGVARFEPEPTHVGPSAVFGWQATFDSGLSVAAAFGAMRDVTADGDAIEPTGYVRAGYVF
jgi:hypothetical protein